MIAFLIGCFLLKTTLTGLFTFTRLASLVTKWLRRIPVRLELVRFLGFPTAITPLGVSL